jgi:hypothetical protein
LWPIAGGFGNRLSGPKNKIVIRMNKMFRAAIRALMVLPLSGSTECGLLLLTETLGLKARKKMGHRR